MNTEQKTKQSIVRELAILSDLTSTQSVRLHAVWQELVNGTQRVFDTFFTAERCYVVTERANGEATTIGGRRLGILEALLCGKDQKWIAIDMDLAPSTVALNARLGLEALGVSMRASRVHPLLMLAARASSAPETPMYGALSFFELDDGEQLRVVSVQRPESSLRRVLPPAEMAVISGLIEGRCYQEIARERGTSTRTIANQITAVFRRMRVSGRNDLLHRLFATENLSLLPPPSAPPPQAASAPMLPVPVPRAHFDEPAALRYA